MLSSAQREEEDRGATFYALHYVPLAGTNSGGIKTNLRCQMLDKHYEPILGLYAAGDLAGMAGGHINGKA